MVVIREFGLSFKQRQGLEKHPREVENAIMLQR